MYKQGDILLIPFPYTDLMQTKQRPVLVLSNTIYNGMHQDIVVAAITSNVTDKDYSIYVTANDLDEGQLKVDSLIRADKIYTFSNRIVIRKFGHLKSEVFLKVKEQIEKLISKWRRSAEKSDGYAGIFTEQINDHIKFMFIEIGLNQYNFIFTF